MSPPAPELLISSNETHVSETCATYDITSTQFHALHNRCAASKATAYCPYSRFRVGASILTHDDQYIDGANVENASYPVGTCAERVAFGKAVTEGHRKFKAVAVSTDISPPASPCGMCRQFIREFCELDMPILMFDKDGAFVVMRLEQLLPMSFGPEALPPPGSAGAQG
ncbi:cytidine deaminase-like protein [Rhexocercosporidium sp. MPI-PUGE-AT-0058]|nr:cytidine deaminase-like protein [Rhexocercosporidium sp. MPI-PUGE-AT-0058]